MNTIPSVDDWKTNPEGALTASLALAKQTVADAGASPSIIALGIAAQVLSAAAPLVGAVLAGPLGGAAASLAAAAVHEVALTVAAQHEESLAGLTDDEKGLVNSAIALGVNAATAKLVTP